MKFSYFYLSSIYFVKYYNLEEKKYEIDVLIMQFDLIFNFSSKFSFLLQNKNTQSFIFFYYKKNYLVSTFFFKEKCISCKKIRTIICIYHNILRSLNSVNLSCLH